MPATRTTGGTRSACSPPCGEETRGDASMNDKLDDYVDGVFAPYEGAKSISELKANLLADLHERFRELKAEGQDDAAAFELTIASIGDIAQTVQEVSNRSRSLERQPVTRFDASLLGGSDFAGVKAPAGKFEASMLPAPDFSPPDLTRTSFTPTHVADANS